MNQLRVVDYAPAPGGRFARDGEYSGEWFRDKILVPALKQAVEGDKTVSVDLDGAAGYSSSFLEEAFGGLIRNRLFTPGELEGRLSIMATDPVYAPYQELAARYLADAKRALSKHAA